MKKIRLNKDISIDLGKLIESKLLIQANSGGGKSWAIRRLVEQAFGEVQIIILDTEGEFANLREKNDFVLAGADGDAPVDVRSAELLARRLLELKASTIIDLYELLPQNRKHFVKLFLNALVNAPKDLWPINHGDCLVILDEAHIFAPEKGESEALDAVTAISSLGRKRGLGLVLATQRIAKLNKDAAAECNNKLIGRASLDVDRKRAAEEIGFVSKEEILSLRNLEPGEFYAFGPSISREVIKMRIGDIDAKPPGRGQGTRAAPAPTEKVRKILAKLANLPQEARKEAETIDSLKREIFSLKQAQKGKEAPIDHQRIVNSAVSEAIREKDRQILIERKKFMSFFNAVSTYLESEIRNNEQFLKLHRYDDEHVSHENILKKPIHVETAAADKAIPIQNMGFDSAKVIKTGAGEIKVLTAIAQHEKGVTREQLSVLTGYTRSSRNTYLQRLSAAGFIGVDADTGRTVATSDGISRLGSFFTPLPSGSELQRHMIETLPKGESEILRALIASYPSVLEKEHLSEITGYTKSSRNTYLQRLAARELICFPSSSTVKASENLF